MYSVYVDEEDLKARFMDSAGRVAVTKEMREEFIRQFIDGGRRPSLVKPRQRNDH
jgi:hypothetical protein